MSEPGSMSVSPDDAQLAQAEMNALAARANDLAARMASLNMPADVAIQRGAGPGTNFKIGVQVKVGVHAQIAMFEVLCDILEARQRQDAE